MPAAPSRLSRALQHITATLGATTFALGAAASTIPDVKTCTNWPDAPAAGQFTRSLSRDLVLGNHSQDGIKLGHYYADYVYPTGFTGPRPLIIRIHGGGWTHGMCGTIAGSEAPFNQDCTNAPVNNPLKPGPDQFADDPRNSITSCSATKGAYGCEGPIFAAAGYAMMSIEYPLADTDSIPFANAHPYNVRGILCAIKYAKAHAADIDGSGQGHAINPSHIILMGSSAGGHLAALAGLIGSHSSTKAPDISGTYSAALDSGCAYNVYKTKHYSAKVDGIVEMYGFNGLVPSDPGNYQWASSSIIYNTIGSGAAVKTLAPNGQTYGSNATSIVAPSASPSRWLGTYAASTRPWFMQFHGSNDGISRVEDVSYMDGLIAANTTLPHIHVEMQGPEHGWFWNVNNSNTAYTEAKCTLIHWMLLKDPP